MKASVIIPTYNAAASLARTLASLTFFSKEKLAEVFVCDDGSEDDTELTARRFNGKLPLNYLRQDHRGFRAAAARNLGIKRATGDVVIFMDSDVVLPRGFLDAHFESHEVCTRNHLVFGYRRRVSAPPPPNTDLYAITDYEPDHRETQLAPEGRGLHGSPTPWYFAYSCNLSVSGNLRSQLFDEDFIGWGNEDLEFAYRAVQSNSTIAAAPAASLWHVDEHDIRDPFRSDSHEADFSTFIINSVRMQLKHGSDPILWSLLEADLIGYRIENDRCICDSAHTDPISIRAWATAQLNKKPSEDSPCP
jgi:glycosyltransferase involved in cell wall biosynthesis